MGLPTESVKEQAQPGYTKLYTRPSDYCPQEETFAALGFDRLMFIQHNGGVGPE